MTRFIVNRVIESSIHKVVTQKEQRMLKQVNPKFPIGTTVLIMSHGAKVKEIQKYKPGTEAEEFEYLCEPLQKGVKLCGCPPTDDCNGFGGWFLEHELIGFET